MNTHVSAHMIELIIQQAVPRKTTRAKRKKSNVLAEISVNVPRGGNGRRNQSTHPAKVPKSKLGFNRDSMSELTPSLGHFGDNRDIFQDDDGSSGTRSQVMPGILADFLLGVFESRSFSTPSQREHRSAFCSLGTYPHHGLTVVQL